jgi:Mce-associated membrane protein
LSRNTPRRPSRTSTPRPRRIAGRDAVAETTDVTETAETPETTETARAERPPVDDEPQEGALASPRATRWLLVLLAVFVVLLVLQGAWFFFHERENDDRAEAAQSSAEGGEDDPISVPSGRPVILDQLAVQEGVEAAALAAQTMFARNWKSYDQGVDDAVALMTEDFAETYRGTTDDVRRKFVSEKTQVQVRVVAQSVRRANDTELEALLFLNQYTVKGQGEDATTTYTPYRALLTMVHTDKGWLVDGVATK